jgi:hypothetical protein
MITGFLNLFRVPRQEEGPGHADCCWRTASGSTPIPGVNYSVLLRTSRRWGGFAFGIMNALSGARVGSCMLFTLGVMPYISASIIFSLLVGRAAAQGAVQGGTGRAAHHQPLHALRDGAHLHHQALFLVYGQLGEWPANVVDPGLYAEWYYKIERCSR